MMIPLVYNAITYLLIGATLAFISDITMKFFIQKPELEFSNLERIVIILLWPLYVAIIIFGPKSKK